MKSTITRQEDGTIVLTISIPQTDVAKNREAVIEDAVKTMTVKGFRKGKAPRKIAEEQLDQARVKEETLKRVLPTAYIAAVQEHNLHPIMNPKIHVQSLADDKEWEFTATTCEAPVIELGNYKKEIQNITAKAKIIIPGKESQPAKLDDIIKTLLDTAKITIPSVLLEQEVERLLAQTLDEIKRLGLSLDQYLSSTGQTAENLRTTYEQKARNDMSFEFALSKIAEEEKITVEPKEVEEAIQKAKDEAERKNLEANRYLLASILRQQKTLDFLKNL